MDILIFPGGRTLTKIGNRTGINAGFAHLKQIFNKNERGVVPISSFVGDDWKNPTACRG
jgi:hypothetical protein